MAPMAPHSSKSAGKMLKADFHHAPFSFSRSLRREAGSRADQHCWPHNQILMTVCFPSYMFIVLSTLIKFLVPQDS